MVFEFTQLAAKEFGFKLEEYYWFNVHVHVVYILNMFECTEIFKMHYVMTFKTYYTSSTNRGIFNGAWPTQTLYIDVHSVN